MLVEWMSLYLSSPLLSSLPPLRKRYPSSTGRPIWHTRMWPYPTTSLRTSSSPSSIVSPPSPQLASFSQPINMLISHSSLKHKNQNDSNICFPLSVALSSFMVQFLRSCLCFLTSHLHLIHSLLTEDTFQTSSFSTAAQYHLPSLLVPSLNLFLFLSKALVQAQGTQRRSRHDPCTKSPSPHLVWETATTALPAFQPDLFESSTAPLQ